METGLIITPAFVWTSYYATFSCYSYNILESGGPGSIFESMHYNSTVNNLYNIHNHRILHVVERSDYKTLYTASIHNY